MFIRENGYLIVTEFHHKIDCTGDADEVNLFPRKGTGNETVKINGLNTTANCLYDVGEETSFCQKTDDWSVNFFFTRAIHFNPLTTNRSLSYTKVLKAGNYYLTFYSPIKSMTTITRALGTFEGDNENEYYQCEPPNKFVFIELYYEKSDLLCQSHTSVMQYKTQVEGQCTKSRESTSLWYEYTFSDYTAVEGRYNSSDCDPKTS